jgi:hypothetical protein
MDEPQQRYVLAGRERVNIKKVRTSCKGRKCKFPHCKQTLNIYNHEIYCHLHLRQFGLISKKLSP